MSPLLDESSGTLPLPTPKPKRFLFTQPPRGYTSRHWTLFPHRKQSGTFKRAASIFIKCSIPSGMRILDVGILAEAMTNLTCSACNRYLVLYESEYLRVGTQPSI